MDKSKIIKYLVVPIVGILLLAAYYNVNSGKSTLKGGSPIMSAPLMEASAGTTTVEVVEKPMTEVYEDAADEEARKRKEWEKINAQNPNVVAAKFGEIVKGEPTQVVDYNQLYADSLKKNNLNILTSEETQSEPIEEQIQRPVEKQQTARRQEVQPTAPVTTDVSSNQRPKASFNTSTYSASSSATNFSDGNTTGEVSTTTIADSESIKAVVYGEHKIRPGEPLRIRTVEEGYINGKRVPRNTIFTTITSGSGTRLRASVDKITVRGNVMELDMDVYDTDHLKGISVPFDLGRSELAEGAGNAVDDATDYTVTTSTSDRVANSVVNSVGDALTKASKQKRVTIQDGHELILKRQ